MSKNNPGTYEGDIQEIQFVRNFNRDKFKYSNYLSKFGLHISSFFLVRVTTRQYSNLCKRKVFTRADAYLIYSLDSLLLARLNSGEYYIDENFLNEYKIKYEIVPGSGLSIKSSYSQNYQILKMGPESFKNLFCSYELGAGASLYCKDNKDLYKNFNLLKGWKTSPESMCVAYEYIIGNDCMFFLDKNKCFAIKQESLKNISKLIDESKSIREKIFNGVSFYQEPYIAWFFTNGTDIKNLIYLNYYITTGSGRTKGNYTLVIKPN